MPAFALLAGASIAVRAASLNLCTDEYLLLLAPPERIVSVSFLSRDPAESPLWRSARSYPANAGTLDSVVAHRPDLVLTMGGGGRMSGAIAGRLGIRSIDLRPPHSLADVAGNVARVAAALGRPERARPLLARLDRLRRTAPARQRDALWLGGGGQSIEPAGIGGRWLALAGLRQRRVPGGRVDRELLLTAPPTVVLRSDYRGGQYSRGTAWLDHPAIRRLAGRTLTTDGRRWTCMGPLLIGEVGRLRSLPIPGGP